MSCGVGCRRGSDLTLLWLWYRSVAVALSTPSLGNSMCCGCGTKRKKKIRFLHYPNYKSKPEII